MIYEAMNRVMEAIGAIQKKDMNTYDKYKYRGIDAVYNAVQPALVKNGVFIVPKLESIEQTERMSKKGDAQIHTKVTVRFTFYAKDGSSVECVFPGEAVDRSDKSINKAMTAAFKYCIFETFCIPTEDLNDADKDSPDIGTAVQTNREKLITFCRNHGIPMDEVGKRFGLGKGSDESLYMSALSTLMDELTPGAV